MNLHELIFANDQQFLWVALFALCALAVVFYGFWGKTVLVKTLAHKNRIVSLFPGYSLGRTLVKTVIIALGFCALSIALLRPQYGKKEQTTQQQGRDLFIALDISRSMLAQDCVPNRLTCAKELIQKIITALQCERVGLILFSGSTFVQCPLTSDYGAFLMYLKGVDVETISSGTTALDQPIIKAIQAFGDQKDRKNKILILVTDGEDFSAQLDLAVDKAVKSQLTLLTVGVGSAKGAPIPLFDKQGVLTGHQLDAQGSVVISRLNQALLTDLAQKSGGMYAHLASFDEVDVITQNLIKSVQKFETYALDDITFSRYQDQYHYAVACAFVLFLLEWLI